jgi:hypothetical protein
MRNKILAVFVLIFLAVRSLGAQTYNALFDLKDASISAIPYTNRTLKIYPLSMPTVYSPSVVLRNPLTGITDNNGDFTQTNLVQGLYRVLVLAPPMQEVFSFLITSNMTSTFSVSTNLVADSTATFPAGSVSFAAAVTDLRYARFGDQVTLQYTPFAWAVPLTVTNHWTWDASITSFSFDGNIEVVGALTTDNNFFVGGNLTASGEIFLGASQSTIQALLHGGTSFLDTNNINHPFSMIAGIGNSYGLVVRSNSLASIPTLLPGDTFYWSSNGVAYVICSNPSGVLTTNKIAP